MSNELFAIMPLPPPGESKELARIRVAAVGCGC
jgi:hypothetical protein